MSSETRAPEYRQIERVLLQHDTVPLMGGAPPFPWDGFLQSLAKVFGIEGLSVEAADPKWMMPDQYHSQVSDTPHPLDIVVGSLEGKALFLMPEKHWALVMGWLLTREANSWKWTDANTREGFIRFAATEVLHLLSKTGYLGDMVPRLARHGELPNEPALSIDLILRYGDQSASARILLPATFHGAWVRQVAERRPSHLDPKIAAQTEIDVRLEIGRMALHQKAWRGISAGDFLILDNCTWDPSTKEGRFVLTVDEKPLFHAQMEAGSMKIVDVASYHEVERSMVEEHSPEDEDLDTDFDLEDEDEDEFSDLEDEDSEEEEGDEAEADEEDEEAAEPVAEATHADASPEESMVQLESIPVSLIVEVGRVRMSMQKLMDLGPGNLLELDATPESSVDLVVNDRVVGRGELLKVGDVLGVRILEKG